MHSRRIDPIKRSTYPFCQGERNDVGRSPMPVARMRALNAPPKCSVIVANKIFRHRIPRERLGDYGVSRYRILSEVRMFQLLMLRMIPPIVIVAPLSLYYSAISACSILDSASASFIS